MSAGAVERAVRSHHIRGKVDVARKIKIRKSLKVSGVGQGPITGSSHGRSNQSRRKVATITIVEETRSVANADHQARTFDNVILNRVTKRRKCFKSLKAKYALGNA